MYERNISTEDSNYCVMIVKMKMIEGESLEIIVRSSLLNGSRVLLGEERSMTVIDIDHADAWSHLYIFIKAGRDIADILHMGACRIDFALEKSSRC